MSFGRQPKEQAVATPNQDAVALSPSERQRRLATGGTRSSFLGGAMAPSLAAPGPTLTGLN